MVFGSKSNGDQIIKNRKKKKNAAFHTFRQREKCHPQKIDFVFPM